MPSVQRSPDPLGRVVLVVSAFRADDAVIDLLRFLDRENPFFQVIVVDSLGSGAISREILRAQWRRVRYVNAERNLGSAGNLALRLELAAETSADYAYAVNHDGRVDLEAIRRLVRAADALPRVGAVYPTRRYVNRGNSLRAVGGGLFHRSQRDSKTEVSPTSWSSSNGALYALSAVRSGCLPDPSLWMGWEDYGLGGLLESRGFAQVTVSSVVVDDPYEYRSVWIGPRQLFVTDKPTWYQYYSVRNLLLIAREQRAKLPEVVAKLAVEAGMVVAVRDQKARRLGFFARGVVDGVLGRRGKWRLP